MRARSLGSLQGKVLEVGLSQHKSGEWKRDLPSRAKNISPGAGSNLNDLLVVSAIILTGSLSADSKGDAIPFVSCSTSRGIAAISSVETVDMDGVSCNCTNATHQQLIDSEVI